jgi:ATP-dependent Clp protease ATP-binding subunit ClpC
MVPFTPSAKKLLDAGLREASALGDRHIGTEHLLLGLVSQKDGLASRVLLELEIDPQGVRDEVLRLLGAGEGGSHPETAHASVAPRSAAAEAIDLEADARVRELLMAAAARAMQDRRTEITLSDLLLSLASHEWTASMFAELGVDDAAMREAIDRHSGELGSGELGD